MTCCPTTCAKAVIIISSFIIIAGGTTIMIVYGYINDNLYAPFFFSPKNLSLMKIVTFAISIAMIVFGLCGFIGSCLNKCCFRSFLMFIFLIGAFLIAAIFLACAVFLIIIAVMNGKGNVLTKVFCGNHSLKIASFGPYEELLNNNSKLPTTCANCATGETSIQDCSSQKKLAFSNPDLYSDLYPILKSVELKFSCVGVCPQHTSITCKYFSEMSVANPKITCLDAAQNTIISRMLILNIVVYIVLVVALLNIISGCTICCRMNSEEEGEEENGREGSYHEERPVEIQRKKPKKKNRPEGQKKNKMRIIIENDSDGN